MGDVRLSDCAFAVLDVETTGLYPGAGDRVMEIAIVGMDSDGGVADEYVTLVDPHRTPHPDAARVNRITERDTRDAPDFAEVAGDVAEGLKGRVLVAHNAPFDVGFLDAEFGRAGHELPEIAWLCTQQLAARTGLPRFNSLPDACRSLGVLHEEVHSALGDARATAGLFAALLRHPRLAGARDLADLGCLVAPAAVDAWPSIPASGVEHRRRAP